MKLFSRFSLAFLFILLIQGCNPGSTETKSGSIFEYFPASPGWSLTYSYASQSNPSVDGKRWLTFQNSAQEGKFSFYYTSENTQARAYSIWKSSGEYIGAENDNPNMLWGTDFWYFFLINMPAQYSTGMSYSVGKKTYTVSTGAAWGGHPDCVRIDFDADNAGPGWYTSLLDGSGCFYLAKDVGLVYLFFQNRTTQATETFSLSAPPKQLGRHKIYGHIQDTDGNPLPDAYLSVTKWLGQGWWGKSDDSGDCSFDFYFAEGMNLRDIAIGYDADADLKLDSTAPSTISRSIDLFGNADYNLGTVVFFQKPNIRAYYWDDGWVLIAGWRNDAIGDELKISIGAWNWLPENSPCSARFDNLNAESDMLPDGAFSDDFADGIVDDSKWNISKSEGASVNEEDGALSIDISSGQTSDGYNKVGGLNTKDFVIRGNFDVQVDIEVKAEYHTTPNTNSSLFLSDKDGNGLEISVRSDRYQAGDVPSSGTSWYSSGIWTDQLSGKLRITRD